MGDARNEGWAGVYRKSLCLLLSFFVFVLICKHRTALKNKINLKTKTRKRKKTENIYGGCVLVTIDLFSFICL